MTKPNPDIFEFAAHKLGVQPEECLMIDDLLSNIQGAERTGMKGVVYSTFEQATSSIEDYLEGRR
ncbi:Fructose-1-phosphate phosphatase YqaB [compost metagenome]